MNQRVSDEQLAHYERSLAHVSEYVGETYVHIGDLIADLQDARVEIKRQPRWRELFFKQRKQRDKAVEREDSLLIKYALLQEELEETKLHLDGAKAEIRHRELQEYRWQCSGCGHFQKHASSRYRCGACKREHYLSGSFKFEDLESWFDVHHCAKGVDV